MKAILVSLLLSLPLLAQQSFITSFNTAAPIRNNFNGPVGALIQVPAPTVATALGRVCISGNAGTHTVELVNATTNTTVASVSVNMLGCVPPFKFTTLAAPVTLAANFSYYLASVEVSGGDKWYDYTNSQIKTSLGTVMAPVYGIVSTGQWIKMAGSNESYVPANFLYNIPAAPVVSAPPAATVAGIVVGQDNIPKGTFTHVFLDGGTGVIMPCKSSGDSITCSPTSDTSLIPTHATIHENENYLVSTNGTTGYTATAPKKLLERYSEGMAFLLKVDATCVTACTLEIDAQGPVTIKRSDGLTDPNGLLVAGRAQWVWFDGKIFRLMY